MHITFLTHYFPPEVNAPATRTIEHARVWVEAGHEVTVVTCAPNHPTGRVYKGYRNRLWQREIVDGIEVIRLWTLLSPNEGFLRRSLNFISYLATATAAAAFLPRTDVVVSTSPQFFCGLAGYAVSRIKRRPWVLEIRDLWPETILTVGAIRGGRVTRLLETMADWAYRAADRVVALTDAFRSHIVAHGASPQRVGVIKNGVDLAAFTESGDGASVRHALGLEGKFVAAYVGTHGLCQKLETLLYAAKMLEGRSDVALLMVGGGAERARLVARKEELGLSNVTMIDQLPKEQMPGLLAATDACLVPLMRDDVFKTVIPSKMFEAMAMRRPIVLGVEGEARALLDEAGAGIGIIPEGAEELAAAILRLADDPVLAERLGAAGRAHVEAHFDRRVLAGRYLRLLEEVVNERQAAPRPLSETPQASRAGQ
jgi:glycosyltransferase involved in cell wall biosynthesis